MLTDARVRRGPRSADDEQALASSIMAGTPRPAVAVVNIGCPRPTRTRGSWPPQTIAPKHPEVGVLVLSQYVESTTRCG